MDLDFDLNDSSKTSSNVTILNGELFHGSYLLLFFLFSLPTVLLSAITICAICKVRISWTVKIVLLNIFAAEIYFSLSLAARFLSYYVRLPLDGRNVATTTTALCNLSLFAVIASGAAKLLFTAFYAIMVFVFVRCNLGRVKWQYMIPPILFLWALSMALGVPLLLPHRMPPTPGGVFFYRGFCPVDLTGFDAGNAGTFLRLLVIRWVTDLLVCGGIIATFCVLTLCHINRNAGTTLVVAENSNLKEAIAKNLFFLAMAAFVNIFITVGIPTIVRFTNFEGRGPGPDDDGDSDDGVEANRRSMVRTDFIVAVLRCLASVYTPVVTIVLLKPVRDALRQCCVLVLWCRRGLPSRRGEEEEEEKERQFSLSPPPSLAVVEL